jgi:LmeA-like phospholipid-binding
MISKVLSGAIKLFLRTQVDRVEELKIEITGGDRQILKGYIPGVFLKTDYAIYQGIHLRGVQLTGENIRVNLSQVLKGKPLRLLEPIPIKGNLQLEESDLQASLSSSLLSQGLDEFLLILLEANGVKEAAKLLQKYEIIWQKIALNADLVRIDGNVIAPDGEIGSFEINTGLQLSNSHTLNFSPLSMKILPELLDTSLDRYEIDLGEEVVLEEVNLKPGKISCCGGLTVLP